MSNGLTVEILNTMTDSISLRMEEVGPIIIYSAKGEPISSDFTFSVMGGGFYKGIPSRSVPDNEVLKISR